jgi:hypothetical protein
MNDKLSILRRVIPEKVQQKVGRELLKLDKHSPHILFGVGIVGFGATVVLASRATLQVEGVVEEFHAKKDEMHEALDLGSTRYTEREFNQDLVLIYIRAGLNLAKLYGPTILVGTVAVACLTKSHAILTTRNAAISAAYAGLDKAFGEYRKRVEEEIGADKENALYRGEREVVVHNTEKGEVETVIERDQHGYSQYARFFDEGNLNWTPLRQHNFFFLRAQQNYFNDILKVRGHLFLNEVYDRLGLERSPAGAVVGWILTADKDSFVDLGIFDRDRERVRSFMAGDEPSIRLDFNVDGIIYDKI